MPRVSPGQTNFSGGEFDPLFTGRVDHQRYRSGYKLGMNIIPTVQGAATRRPGTEVFLSRDRTPGRKGYLSLIPFYASVDTTSILAVRETGVFDVIENGVVVSSVIDPLTGNAPQLFPSATAFERPVTGYAQINDVIFVTGTFWPRRIQRISRNRWEVREVAPFGGPFLPNIESSYTMTISDFSNPAGKINASRLFEATVQEKTASRIRITITGDFTDEVKSLVRINANFGISKVGYEHPSIVDMMLTSNEGEAWISNKFSGGTDIQTSPLAVGDMVDILPGVFEEVSDNGRLFKWEPTNNADEPTNMPEYFNLVWDDTDSRPWRMNFTQEKNNFANVANGQTTKVWALGSWDRHQSTPRAVTLHEDRLVFGGASRAPQQIAMSRVNDFEGFNLIEAPKTDAEQRAIQVADSPIDITLASRDQNTIQWIESTKRGLTVGTSGSEWQLTPSRDAVGFTPRGVNAKEISNNGSPPGGVVRAQDTIIHYDVTGRSAREVVYRDDVGHTFSDLNILARSKTISGVVASALIKSPQQIVWSATADGVLLGMTYQRSVDGITAGWHRHGIGGDGKVVDLVSLSTQSGHELWLVVERGSKRYIERMGQFLEEVTEDNRNDFVPLDGAIRTSTTDGMISGLQDYGTSAHVVADNIYLGEFDINAGTMNIGVAANVVWIGYNSPSWLVLLRFEDGSRDGTSAGKSKRINRLGFHIHNTAILEYGKKFDDLKRVNFTETGHNPSEAIPLFAGIKSVSYSSGWDFGTELIIQATDPLPMTILQVLPQMKTEDRA